MKQLFLPLALFCLLSHAQAQMNHVLNPDFEDYVKCPFILDQIRLAKYWAPIDTNGNPNIYATLPLGSAEYCNSCANPNFDIGVPSSSHYHHYPRSGAGMVQAIMFFDEGYPEAYKRDYVQGRIDGLTPEQNYCVTFYVALEQSSQYAIKDIGAYIDDGSIDIGQDSLSSAAPQTAFTPQIVAPYVIYDTLTWAKVQGIYNARGNEKFITIGNFLDDNHTTASLLAGQASKFSWYLIDDVSIVAVSEKAQAGPGRYVSPGSDSVTLGTAARGMPCEWYLSGDTLNAIGYGASMRVHPTVTTTYMVKLDLMTHVTWDTVTVWVAPAGVDGIKNGEEMHIWPNPASNELHIENGANKVLHLFDAAGKEVYKTALKSNDEEVPINSLADGVYTTEVTEGNDVRMVQKVVVRK